MKLHLLTLKFSGNSSQLEAPFLSDYYRVSLPQIRISLVLGALLYAAFGILDALLMPEQKYTTWFIRFVIVCPVLFGTLLASFSKSFERYMQPLLASVFILAGGGIICMIVIAPSPVSYSYYAGLLLVSMWGYTFIRILFIWASLAGWVLVVLYEIAAIWISPTPFAVLLSNNFFFISANVIGMLACYSIEFYARRDFFLTQQLEIEREKVNKINQELEERVEKRTADYQIINRALEQEITGHKQTEEALRESESKYRFMTDNVADIIWTVDMNLNFTYISPSVQRFRGLTVEEAMAQKIHEVLTPASLQYALKVLEEENKVLMGNPDHIRDKLSIELEEYCKDGSTIWTENELKYLPDQDGKPIGIIGVTRDISARKQAEAALRESEKKYRLIAENTADMISILDMNLRFTYVSPTSMRLRGFTVEEAMEQPLEQVLTPESMRLALTVFEKEMELEASGTADPDRMRILELEEYKKDGSIVWVEVNTSFLRDKDRKLVEILVVTRDITERKRVEEEKRKLEERLQRAEKMEALGTLAGGVAHDLNNVLGVIIGYAELLLIEMDKLSPIRPRLTKIMNGSEKAAAIVQDLLTLARRGVPIRQVFNLNKLIFDYQNSPELEKLSSYHSAVRIKLDLEPDLLNISGSPIHLGKALFNLVSNAVEAMPKGGDLTIKTTNQYLDKPVHGYDHIREGDYVVLSVTDTGGGIPSADLQRIFEPFYTKKVMGRSGTGLGLAVVWGTVKDHQGYINVQSEEGKGSTFMLYFPITREDVTLDPASVSISKYMGNGETILVVDDVREQCDLAAEILKKLNYKVSSVSSGEEAIAYIKEYKVDLLVLDMIMDPGMDGLDTYMGILEIQPKQKAIIVSGFSETERVDKAHALGAGAYVKKPYVIEKLGMAVRKELDRSA